MSVPRSLRTPELDRLWAAVRDRLESRGGSRGRVKLPGDLSSASRLALKSLLGRPVKSSLDLAALETALAGLGVGQTLESAVAALGHPVSGVHAARRAERAARRQAREAGRETAASWPEPWARTWIGEVIRAGLFRKRDVADVQGLLQRIRAVLDHLDTHPSAPISRVDLAAQVLGDSHALDTGTREEAAVARALAHKLGQADHRDLWAQAGVHLDLTSTPVLTWRLPVAPAGGLAPLAGAALEAGIPLHVSRFALERHPVTLTPGERILVVENPRVVEAAAQLRAPAALLSTNGNPGSAVLLLLTQLREAGAILHYHGDFDTAGLAICERMTRFGLIPWRMDAGDYQAALADADSQAAALPKETRAPGPTPWDPTLQPLFDRERRIVHEERLLERLLG